LDVLRIILFLVDDFVEAMVEKRIEAVLLPEHNSVYHFNEANVGQYALLADYIQYDLV